MTQVKTQLKVKQSKYSLKQLFHNWQPYLRNQSPFVSEPNDQDWYESVMDFLNQFQVLVVGAGGLGCQIVKNLALSGIRKIHLVDMDTIDLTNLNRQFLFRLKDINRKKAQVVAQFIMRRCPGVEVIPHTCKVQQKQYDFYKKFNMIIGGLDNIEARKYLNGIVHQLNLEAQQTQCMYIDGATQGFQGQCVVVQPFKGSCYNCSLLDGLTHGPKVNYCTIANTPRTPQHCIQYVLELEWEKHYPGVKRDNDNLEHMTWIYEKSLERAKKYKIEGVTEMLTLGVAKNIIPAIASTNALIAAFCTNQALKIFFNINPKLKNFFFYRGGTSTGSDSYELAKKPECQSCDMRKNNLKPLTITIQKSQTFKQLLQKIHQANTLISTEPYVDINEKIFYNPVDAARKAAKQAKMIKQLIQQGILKGENDFEIVVTDCGLKSEQKVIVNVVEDTPKEIVDNSW